MSAPPSLSPPSASSPPAPSPWQVLRTGNFAFYMGGEAVSMLGTWVQQTAQGWVLASLTTSNFTLGLVNFVSGVPVLVLSLFGGVIADRFQKRRILLVTQVLQALIAVAVGWMVALHRIEIWHIVVAGFFLGIIVAFEMPAASALVPELVEKDALTTAIAVDRAVFHGTRLAGPPLAGLLIAWLGQASAFFANSLSYGALFFALLKIRPRAREIRIEKTPGAGGLKEGLAYVKSDRPTLAMISLLGISTFCLSPFFMVLMPNYAQHVLLLKPELYGILVGSSGGGSLAGSIWLLSISAPQRAIYLRCGVVLMAFALGGLALASGLATAMFALLLLTLGSSTVFGLANTIVQERAPDTLRGRVSALAGLSFFGVLPFSGLAVSAFADAVGIRAAMGCCALIYLLAASAVVFTQSRQSLVFRPPSSANTEVA